jgi:uncharacterized protein (DUF1778 family)
MPRTTPSLRSDNINIRATPDMIGLIDRAAKVYGKTRTDFILDTMCKVSEEVVLDQDKWNEFNKALDAPTRSNENLEKLLSRKPVWNTPARDK